MLIARREFLNLLGVAAGAAGASACSQDWAVPDRLVEMALRGPGLESHVQTICGLCQGACGLTVRLVDGVPVGLKGNPNHPLNRGGLCPVGQSGLEVLYAPNRLQGPLRRDESGNHRPVSWEEALREIAGRISELAKAGQGQRIALLAGEPNSLFLDLAQRILLLLGSSNTASTRETGVLPYNLAQGIDEVPGFDLSSADLVLSFGLDLYEDGPAPLHAIAALIGDRPTEGRGSLLHVGTRLSPSAAKAEQYVTIRPGTHAAFALGVAHLLVREGRYDHRFVADHTFGFDDWEDDGRLRPGFRRMLLERYYPDRVAQLCGCDPSSVMRVARRFAKASAPLALAGGEATQGSNSTWSTLAAHALNALMGAFDRPGGVVLAPEIPLTPLPPLNGVPAGPSALFAACLEEAFLANDPVEALANRVLDGSHPVDILLMIGSNPLRNNPAGERLGQAMAQIPMVVSISPFLDETCSRADYVLPSHHFLEGWQGLTTPTSAAFSVVGLANPVVEPLYDTRQAGDILLQLARQALPDGKAAIPWENYLDYLKNRLQGLSVSGQGSIMTGSFEESWRQFLEERGWRFLEHKELEEFWSGLVRQAGWWSPVSSRGDWGRLFRTSSKRYEFFSLALQRRMLELGRADDGSLSDEDALQRASRLLKLSADPDEVCLPHFEPPHETGEGDLTLVPFRPLTGRGDCGVHSPMLMEMSGYPVLSGWQTWAELSPETARRLGVEYGDQIALESDRGRLEAVVRVQPGAAPDVVHVPLGLDHREGGETFSAASNPIEILLPMHDMPSGALSLNSTRVRLRLIRRRPHGEPPPTHRGETT